MSDDLDAMIAVTADAMAVHGRAVLSTPDDSASYTVGRTMWGKAELIVAGQRIGHAARMRILIRAMDKEDDSLGALDLRTLVADETAAAAALGFAFRVELADADDAPIEIARLFYPDLTLLQIVLPADVPQQLWPRRKL